MATPRKGDLYDCSFDTRTWQQPNVQTYGDSAVIHTYGRLANPSVLGPDSCFIAITTVYPFACSAGSK